MIPIGIDLGTSNSVVCKYEHGEATVVPLEGQATVPSVVYLDGGKPIVGRAAKSRILINPTQVLASTKRNIGTDWKKTIQGTRYTPVYAARFVLSYLKTQAEAELGTTIRDVVVTVPAYFNDDQRRDTKQAAEEAGLNVLRLLPEPTAAAIAYGLDKDRDQIILVFDLGGGTFDVSILEVLGNTFMVKAVDGNDRLGGDDFDLAIVEYLNTWIEENTDADVRSDPIAQQTLKEAAEEAKITLTERQSTDIVIPPLKVDIDRFKRSQFEKLIQPFLDEMLVKTQQVIRDAGLTVEDLNRIVMVGGSCKIPAVEAMLKEHFKQPYQADDMDVYVSKGAAIVCASLFAPTDLVEPDDRPEALVFQDRFSHSLGIDIKRNVKRSFFSTKRTIAFLPVIPRNTPYPCKEAVLGVAEEWQEKVRMQVYRGEDSLPEKNKKLGELTIELTPKNIGDHQVPVAAIFELDESGILTLTQVEMPLAPETADDLEQLFREAESRNSLVSWEQVKKMIQQYRFKTKKTTLKTI